MTAHVNENCIGCGLCVNICPDVFTMTDTDTASAKGEISHAQEQLAQQAAESCPVDAIEVS